MEDAAKGMFNKEYLDKWYYNYGKLKPHIGKNELPIVNVDEELAQWVSIQLRIRHMLPGELKEKLEELGFVMEETISSWDALYRQLASFVHNNGHVCLPADHKHEALKDWLIRQIINRRYLSESQFERLNSLGVDWDTAISRDHRWEQMYLRLKSFYGMFGHCRVPQRWAKDKQLALWVTVQRRMHVKNRLREDRQRKLSEIGFMWDIQTVYSSQWERYFQQLASFHQMHGHCRVPGNQEKLASWIERQRTGKSNNLLLADRERRLNEINFIWSFGDIKKKGWEEKYRQLCAYKKKKGHCFVPVNCRENKALGTWVATQRGIESRGRLEASKKRKLSDLGFVWSRDTQKQLKSSNDAQWESSFEKLKAYWQAHGSLQVSLSIDPALQRWTSWQRKLFHQNRLSQDRIDRLNEIHFPWSVQEGYWMKMYEALADFSIKFGHTCVPAQWMPNPQLSAWVYRMRLNKLNLSTQKVELLEQIGFKWTLRRRRILPWKTMYRRLVEFQQDHGHTRVPVKWHEDQKLGKWVSRMRQERGKLDAERVLLLEAIGFEWRHRLAYNKNSHTNGCLFN